MNHFIDLNHNHHYLMETTPEECHELSQQCEVTVQTFKACFEIKKSHLYGGFLVLGALTARVIQVCSVTSKKFSQDIAETFSIHIVDEKHKPIPEEEDITIDIDYHKEGMFDLDALAVQYLILSLDPYPKAPDA